jgi:hypothetical protein
MLAFVQSADQILEFSLDFCKVKKTIGLGRGLNILSQLVDIGLDRSIMIFECRLDFFLYT